MEIKEFGKKKKKKKLRNQEKKQIKGFWEK